MDEDLKFDTDLMRKIAGLIASDTTELRTQTDQQLGKIDDTCKVLPPFVYSNLTLASNVSITAFLNRSMDIRDRISTILKQAAAMVEEEEKKIEALFN